ncbi:MAG: hypothetical protein ACREK1_03860 [Longimicrobiales bacterium]
MHWIKVTNPEYEQSRRYIGQVGEVVGHWGPDNSADTREGYLVEFSDGEIVGVTDGEVEEVEDPAIPVMPKQANGCR